MNIANTNQTTQIDRFDLEKQKKIIINKKKKHRIW